jgi:hypothetical protein
MHFMAYRNAAEQGALFTTDYHNSMRAAFSVAEFRSALSALGNGVRLISSPIAPFMVIIRSPALHCVPSVAHASLRALWRALPTAQQADFEELRNCFKMKRLAIPILHK